MKTAAQAAERLDRAVHDIAAALAAECVADGRVSTHLLDEHQEAAYHLAFLAAEATAATRLVEFGSTGDREALIARVALADLIRSARNRIDGRELGTKEDLRGGPLDAVVGAGSDPATLAALAQRLTSPGSGRHPTPEIQLVAGTFRRFSDEKVVPVAGNVHRGDLDVPEEIITGMADLGAFGMSIPAEYGGFADPGVTGAAAMVAATEELSRGSLMAGSLLTRPEILVTALLEGGTEAQKRRWLPAIASGDQMVAVSVTEPDHGSDVARIRCMARRQGDGWVLSGTKTWATFAGRAELLMVLARTNPDPNAGARGLSLFVVEKPAFSGRSFSVAQPDGGTFEGRAIPTIGYRGLHSFELNFNDWHVPSDAMIGEAGGEGRGFFLQMGAFATGRLQTAARALGVMQAAFEEAHRYARERSVFGRPLVEFGLTQATLARMAARIQANRLLTYHAASRIGTLEGQMEAAAAKALASRAAEEITRDAMQVHGGFGYAEEYPVSRLFVDARVLSIFEGTEEVLAVRVIAKDLIGRAAHGNGDGHTGTLPPQP